MDLAQAVEALRKQLNRGKGVLKHQPVKREVCEQWTDETRKVLAEVYDRGAKQSRDFFAANRKIFTSFETDPSYYLTQVVANLHRELRVLEQVVKEKEGELEAEEALLALKGGKRARPKIPAFFWAVDDAGTRDVLAFLESQNLAVSTARASEKENKDLLLNLATQKELRYAVVVAAGKGGGRSAGDSAMAESLLVAGYLAGRLGRTRVLVLADARGSLPPAAESLRVQPLADSAAWQNQIVQDLAKLGP